MRHGKIRGGPSLHADAGECVTEGGVAAPPRNAAKMRLLG